jgi:hypothetical protein
VGNSDPEMSQGEEMSLAEQRKAMEEIGEEEEVSKVDGIEALGVEQLAAIPEASPELSSVWRSKRRAGEVDEFVGLMAERCKSIRNEGTSFEPDSVLPALDSVIISNFHSIGVSLGQDSECVNNASMPILKNMAALNYSVDGLGDKKTQVLEKAVQDRLEEDELDKIFLKNICSEFMEVVMDLGNDFDVILSRA